MDEYAHQLELLLSQDNFAGASNSMEKALISMQIPSTLSRVTPMQPPTLTSPTKTSNLIGKVNLGSIPQNTFDFLAINSQLSSMPTTSLSTSYINYMKAPITTTSQVGISSMDSYKMTDRSLSEFLNPSFPDIVEDNFYQLAGGCSSQQQPAEKNLYYHLGGYPLQQQPPKQNYLYQTKGGCHPYEQPLRQNFYHVMGACPPQHPQQQQVLLRGYIGLENQVPFIDQQMLFAFIGPNPTYLNPSGNPMDPNWEGINSFLLGQVRPGPDIARVYKCSICSIEFPNAQAFGGHMSSHSKHKRRQRTSTTKGQFKKVKLNPSSTDTRKAIVWPLSRKSTPLKETKNDKQENKKVDYESDESMSNSFL